MKILIAYASKTGTAADCAKKLSEELRGQEITLVDLDREPPDPAEFDAVILGSSVRYGRARKALKDYLKSRHDGLMRIPHGLFLCCGFGHEFERYVEKIYDAEMRETAFAMLNFGGVLKLPNASLFERFVLNRVRADIRESEIEDGEYTPSLPSILPENISMMASQLRSEMSRFKEKKG